MEVIVNEPTDIATGNIREIESWNGNWIWRAVLCLVSAPDFNQSPTWISKRLNISVANAVDAIEGLERSGLLLREGNTLKPAARWTQAKPKNSNDLSLLKIHSKIAPQLISKIQPTDAYTSQFFVCNREIVEKYKTKFMDLFYAMEKEGREQGASDVIASEISIITLTGDSK